MPDADSTKKSTYWSGTQFCIEAFEGQQNAAAAKRWTCVGQKEACPTTGKPHFQFAVKTPYGPRCSEVRKLFAGAHIKPARNVPALLQYVVKEETRIGDMPKVSNLYPTQDQYWSLVFETLSMGSTDKNFRVVPVADAHWYRDNMSKDQILAALDYATAELIENGYRVESLAVNPQVRSSFAKFSTSLFIRAFADRQTDRQARISSQVEVIPNARQDEEESSGEDTEGEQEVDDSDATDGDEHGEEFDDSPESGSEVSDYESGGD